MWPFHNRCHTGTVLTVRTTSRVWSPIKRCIPRYKSSLRLRGQTCPLESTPEQRCPSYPHRSNQRTSRWHSCPSARRTGTIGSPTHNLRGLTGVCSGPITFLHCHWLDPTAHDIVTRDHRGPTTFHWACVRGWYNLPCWFTYPKTKIQNVGSGPQPPSILVDGNPVDSVSTFTYLGSLQSSDGYCRPDVRKQITLASSVMSSLDCIWKERWLPLSIKIPVYLALVQSVLLYASETWTLTSADAKSLEAFHMKCQRRILRISWRQLELGNICAHWSTCHQRRHPTSSHHRIWPHRQTAGQHPST